MNELDEPMQEAVLLSRALYEQVREALKMALKAASQPYGMTPEEVSLVQVALAAIEDQP